jgi:hypothetical protein
MGARGTAEGLRQGPREALVHLMAAAEVGASASDGGCSAAAALVWSELGLNRCRDTLATLHVPSDCEIAHRNGSTAMIMHILHPMGK